MLHIVLYQPEIPPNTGNLIRLCANTGFKLHLVEPLGFSMQQKALRRAGLDYYDSALWQIHPQLDDCLAHLGVGSLALQVFAYTTHALQPYTRPNYRQGDVLLFGPETRGLPKALLDDDRMTMCLRIPMLPNSRSLNLANAVSVVAYEAWRQLDFAGSNQ